MDKSKVGNVSDGCCGTAQNGSQSIVITIPSGCCCGTNPDDGGNGGSSGDGSGYTLPVATDTVLGGVKALAKTTETNAVAVDADGKLWSEASVNDSPLIVANLLIGDLSTNAATVQGVTIQEGNRVLCDGVTKLYPVGTASQTLFYSDEFLAYMQANYPDNVLDGVIITMPKIHDDSFELITNENGTAYKYADGRLINERDKIPLIENPPKINILHYTTVNVAHPFMSLESGATVDVTLLTQNDSQEYIYNQSIVDTVCEHLYGLLHTKERILVGHIFKALPSTWIKYWIRWKAKGYWKTYAPRYQYMTINVATVAAQSYSTEEQLTGDTWIDGKPIYSKTIQLTQTTSEVAVTGIVCASPSKIISVAGSVLSANGDFIPLDRYTTSSDGQTFSAPITDGNLVFRYSMKNTEAHFPVKVDATLKYVKGV